MELRRIEPLADTLSGLLRQSLRDVQKVERMSGYGLAMNTWHTQDRSHQVCYVCMAGAVMACSLGAPRDWGSDTIFMEVSPAENQRLRAINFMREGRFWAAYVKLHDKEPDDHAREAINVTTNLIVGSYDGRNSRSGWKDYEKAASLLEAAGL